MHPEGIRMLTFARRNLCGGAHRSAFIVDDFQNPSTCHQYYHQSHIEHRGESLANDEGRQQHGAKGPEETP